LAAGRLTLAALVAVSVWLGIAVPHASACTCAGLIENDDQRRELVEVDFRFAENVFIGDAISTAVGEYGPSFATFSTVAVYKGRVPTTVTVEEDGACGRTSLAGEHVRVGERWVVFVAPSKSGDHHMNGCASFASSEPGYAQALRFMPAVPRPASTGGPLWLAIIVVAGSAGIAVATALVLRRSSTRASG